MNVKVKSKKIIVRFFIIIIIEIFLFEILIYLFPMLTSMGELNITEISKGNSSDITSQFLTGDSVFGYRLPSKVTSAQTRNLPGE